MMNLKIDIWAMLLAMGIFQGVFLSVIILFKYKRKLSNSLLSLLILLIVINLADYLVLHSNLYEQFPYLALTGQPLLFLIGPVYFLYVKSLLDRNFRFSAKHLLHGLILIVPLLYLYPIFFIPVDEKISLLSSIINNEQPRLNATIIFGMVLHTVQTVFYIFLAHRALKTTITNDEATRSNQAVFRLLKSFNIYFALYWIVIFCLLVWLSLSGYLFREADYLVMLFTSISINFMAYMAIGRVKMFETVLINGNQGKYSKSALSPNEITIQSGRLIALLEEEKLYLNSKLRLADLAASLSISTNLLSQVLSIGLGKTFNDLINEYRFQELKQKLLSEEYTHLTIYGLAQESGFNNKYTYSQVFRKFTGMTPSQFLKQEAGSNTP